MSDSMLEKYLNENKLKHFAQESIEKFAEISRLASAKLSEDVSFNSGILAAPNHEAYRNLRGISDTMRKEYQKLKSEPAIGRVVIYFPQNKEVREYYICRGTPLNNTNYMISYHSPMGRLAALDVGEAYDLGEETKLPCYDEQDIIKIQDATFIPINNNSSWDSRRTEYRDTKEPNFKTINSLIKILEQIEEVDPSQYLEKFLQEFEKKNNITEGIRREIVEKFSLRDQVFLDTQQDSIFRLPLNYSLLLLGPAGTGKTTTLIRRLGQKLDFEYGLMDDEKNLVRSVFGNIDEFKFSWIMFTPTNLLKSYLKEAFNREGDPASDNHITTWESYRNELGRDTLKILQTTKFEAGFSPDNTVRTMEDGFDSWVALFDEFQGWLITRYVNELIEAFEKSKNFGFFDNEGFVSKCVDLLDRTSALGKIHLGEIIAILLINHQRISELYKNEKKKIDEIINRNLGLLVKTDQGFIDKYADFIARLEKSDFSEADEADVLDPEIVDEDEEEKLSANAKIRTVIKRYRNFLLWLASKPSGYDRGKSKTKNAKQLEWFGKSLPSSDVLESLNQAAGKVKCLGLLNNPLNKFFNSIAQMYGRFRKEKQSENKFYNPDSALRKKISYGELDFLIFTKLKIAAQLLLNTHINQDDSSFTSSLRAVKKKYQAQVFVDEAPDFSPMQLGSMKLLAHPKLNSFFACGDFNQRLVSEGSKDANFLINFLPGGIQQEYISIPYRQTNSLYNFSLKILQLASSNPEEVKPQKNMYANEGYLPALGENLKDADISVWLAERILEIENTLDGKIPSTAILVPTEEDVAPIASRLKKILNEKSSILVQACHEGLTIGDGRAVRVFDIKHIKGLEFEAAFFVSLDTLAHIYPDLILNYLYVGATRAAQFLGVTCTTSLPYELAQHLKNEFVADWHA